MWGRSSNVVITLAMLEVAINVLPSHLTPCLPYSKWYILLTHNLQVPCSQRLYLHRLMWHKGDLPCCQVLVVDRLEDRLSSHSGPRKTRLAKWCLASAATSGPGWNPPGGRMWVLHGIIILDYLPISRSVMSSLSCHLQMLNSLWHVCIINVEDRGSLKKFHQQTFGL